MNFDRYGRLVMQEIINDAGTGNAIENIVPEPPADAPPADAPPADAPPALPTDYWKEQAQNTRQAATKLATDLKAANQIIEDQKTASLKVKENWKGLYEMAEEKRKTAETQLNTLGDNIQNNAKMTAIRKEAMAAGIKSEALDDLDMIENSMVEIETTSTGRANVLGAKEFIESVKETRAHWFNIEGAPNINTNTPGAHTTHKTYSPKQLLELQRTKPAEYRNYMAKVLAKQK